MTITAAFTKFPVLTTPRLRLRQLTAGDADAFFEILSDEETMRYTGSFPHHSIDETRALIRDVRQQYAQREIMRWAITLPDTDRYIGSCMFFSFDPGFHRAETGYNLNRAYWGQGLMAEAMSAVLTYAFNEMGLHRVEANIDIDNARSKGLLLKLGFTYEGNLRERYVFGDQLLDEHYFGLLDREWQAAHKVSDEARS